MDPENLKIRLYRALSGLTQEKFCQKIGMDAGSYAGHELGLTRPGPDKVERAARVVGVGPDFGDEVLELLDLRRRKRLRVGQGIEDLADRFAATARAHFFRTYERLLTLQPSDPKPNDEDRRQAREQLPRLAALTPSQRAAVVKLGDGEYHAWALAIEAREAALAAAAAENPEEATRMAGMAVEFSGLG
jgi:transcriptional regulator with XRE-family HTH domain